MRNGEIRRLRLRGEAVAIVLLALGAQGSRAAAGEPPGAVTLGAFQAQIAAAQRLTTACASQAGTCDSAALPGDERVNGADGEAFQASWGWLRDAVKDAKTGSAQDRARTMREAGDHLAELATEAGKTAKGSDKATFKQARTAANVILGKSEFQAAGGPTWIHRQLARVQDWFLRLLLGMNHLGEKIPWLAPLIEWTCFLLAAGGLVFFIRRSLARQALRIALGENAASAQREGRDATDWARLAEMQGAAGAWREAIHCLYWAAIVLLEGRRAWRPNPTRTPREYLRLLRTGSEAQRALRELTRSFERVWYGHGEATEGEFRSAQASFAAIAAADLKRSGAIEDRMGAAASPVSAT